MGHRKQERLHMSQRGKSQGHRRKEKSYMSQGGQREGHRKQEKLHMSPKCHHNFYCMTRNEKKYRLTREYLTNTLWGYNISVKIKNNAIKESITCLDIINFYASFET